MKANSSGLLPISAVLIGLIMVPMTLAAQDDTEPEQEEDGRIEEIVVTARMRNESMQDMGVGISVLSGETLHAAGIENFEDIALRSPGLDFESRGPNQNNISMRGVSNGLTATSFQRNNPLVGLFLDDVPIVTSFSTQRSVNLFDLERVEVVRGPQGTLYGEGTVGGAIRYVIQEPSLQEFTGQAAVSVGSTDGASGLNQRYDATLSVPLVENAFGIRLTAFSDQQQGFIDYTQPDVDNANDSDAQGYRLVGLWEPTGNVKAKLTWTDERANSDALWAVSEDAGLVNNVYPVLSSNKDDLRLGSLRLDFQTDYGVFASISGIVDREINNTGMDPVGTSLTGLTILRNFPIDDETFTQEFRFVSAFDSTVNFVAGLYYKTFETDIELALKPEVPLDPTLIFLLDESERYEGDHIAAFGEATFEATERISLIAGLRYFREEVDSFQVFRPSLTFPASSEFRTNLVIDKWLPKLGVEYAASDDVLLYGTYSEGARNGGLSPTSVVSLASLAGTNLPRTYDEDSVQAYELGLKSSWINSALTANLALYYNDWDDYQAAVMQPILFFGQIANLSYFDNAGGAVSYGTEFNVSWLATDNLTLSVAGNRTTAELDGDLIINDDVATNGIGEVIFSPDGARLAFVPEYTLAGAADWSLALRDNLNFVLHLDLQHIGDQIDAVAQIPDPPPASSVVLSGYTLTNLRVGLQSERWSVTAFASNLTNELQLLSGTQSAQGIRYVNKPRTVGVTARFSF